LLYLTYPSLARNGSLEHELVRLAGLLLVAHELDDVHNLARPRRKQQRNWWLVPEVEPKLARPEHLGLLGVGVGDDERVDEFDGVFGLAWLSR
jgi:hypothetical protein